MSSCKEPKPEIQIISGNGHIVEEMHHCPQFSTVHVYDNFTVQIHQNEIHKIEMEGESSLLFYIDRDIANNGALIIKTRENHVLEPTSDIVIKIYSPTTPEVILNNNCVIYFNDVHLEKCGLALRNNAKAYFNNANIGRINITLSNQSIVESEGLTAEIFELSAIASSKIKLKAANFHTATIVSQSAADALLTGTCNYCTFKVKSSGDIDARDMEISHCTIAIESSGNLYANVANTVEGIISGSGNLYIKGDANTNGIIIRSTGKVVPL